MTSHTTENKVSLKSIVSYKHNQIKEICLLKDKQ